MRFLLLTFADPSSEDAPPHDGAATAVNGFNRALREAGVLLGTDRLRPAWGLSHAECVGDRTGTAASVTGYWLIQVRSLDEALVWARRCPLAPDEAIDVRQAIPHEAST